MLVEIVEKQRRAVSVVRTALLARGIHDRSICVTAQNWLFSFGQEEADFAVYVSAPAGTDCEPHYETGKSIADAVKNMIASIKHRGNDAKPVEITEEAPF